MRIENDFVGSSGVFIRLVCIQTGRMSRGFPHAPLAQGMPLLSPCLKAGVLRGGLITWFESILREALWKTRSKQSSVQFHSETLTRSQSGDDGTLWCHLSDKK